MTMVRITDLLCRAMGVTLLLLFASANAWSQAEGARKPEWARCMQPFSKDAPTPYLADLALAGELRKQRECLDARTSKHHQAELLSARETAKQQHVEVITRIFVRDREALAQPPRVNESSWPRLVRGGSFLAQARLVEASGARLIATSSPDEPGRWKFWKTDLTKDTALYYFVESVPGHGDDEARFAQIALTAATHAPMWAESLQRRSGNTGPTRHVLKSACMFDLAATQHEFIDPDGQVLNVAEGDRAVVVFASEGGRESLAAHLDAIRRQDPAALERFDKHLALSKVPGPQSPACDALRGDKVIRTLGTPGMTRAKFRQLWKGSDGGVRALGQQDFEVSPKFVDERVSALDITPMSSGQARSHDEAEALLSRGLGQLAYRQSGKDESGAEVMRTIWRFGYDVYAVLTNRTAAGGAVSMTARMTKGALQTLSPESPQHRQAGQKSWRLLVFHAFRPGILSLCENAHTWPGFERLAMPDPADPLKARWLDEAASIQWQGGRISQAASAAEAPGSRRLLTDACFALFVEGVPVMSGAIVPSYSARRFEFPALVVERTPAGAPLVMTLAPSFPVQAEFPLPAAWAALLAELASAQ